MKAFDLHQSLLLVTAWCAAAWLAWQGPRTPQEDGATLAHLASQEGGKKANYRYRRIVSASTVADRILLEIAEPERIVAFTAQSARGPEGHRFRGSAQVESLERIESIVALKPDLVIVSNVAEPARVARLRESGLTLLDLGPTTGWPALLRAVDRLGRHLELPQRASLLRRRLEQSAVEIAADIEPRKRKRAIYLVSYGAQLYGGTKETSFGDVVRFAGLVDAAASTYRGWPQYRVEELLKLDAELLVSHRAMAQTVCATPGMAQFGPCRSRSWVEIDEALLGDPGIGMLDAAQSLRREVYGLPRPAPSF